MALIMALILLVVVTLVGLAAIGVTILQNSAAANQLDRQVAFQGAEAAMRQAQVAIQTAAAGSAAPAGFEDCSTPSGNTSPVTACLANPFNDNNPAVVVATVASSNYNPGSLAAAQPQYVVQYMGKFLAPNPPAKKIGGQNPYGQGGQNPLADYYRITSRSGDPATVGNRAIVTLQSTFRN
ncbi:MAG: pilus assembly protein [Proteobacteria bacterium]|nr:pilus assembly protein [Pseudomonadota bacterium]